MFYFSYKCEGHDLSKGHTYQCGTLTILNSSLSESNIYQLFQPTFPRNQKCRQSLCAHALLGGATEGYEREWDVRHRGGRATSAS